MAAAGGSAKCYKKTCTFNERLLEVMKIRRRYPERYPVIIEKAECERYLPAIAKIKFLVPEDFTMSHMIRVFRDRLKLDNDKAIFMLINNQIYCNSTPISQVYADQKDDDGFLYVQYVSMETFGC